MPQGLYSRKLTCFKVKNNADNGWSYDGKTFGTMKDNLAVSSRQVLRTRGTLESLWSKWGLHINIESISYENVPSDKDSTKPCEVTFLCPEGTGKNSIFIADNPNTDNATTSSVQTGSVFGYSFSVRTNILTQEDDRVSGGASLCLGNIDVEWKPAGLKLGPETGLDTTYHGPLPLSKPYRNVFRGPSCYVEHAPFDVAPLDVASKIKMAEPFDVRYRIENRSSLHQILITSHAEEEDGGCIFATGSWSGEMAFMPGESRILSFHCIATVVGRIRLPLLKVASVRHNSWVIHEDKSTARNVFVVP